MGLINKLLIPALSLTLLGCNSSQQEDAEIKNYFAKFNMHPQSGAALAVGDFDNDGDLDIILAARTSYPGGGRLYFFENDGKGYFTLRSDSTSSQD